MKTRPCEVSTEGGEPLSPAVGLSDIISSRTVPRFPYWKKTLLRGFCTRRDGTSHCTVNLVKRGGGSRQGPRGGRTATFPARGWTDMKQWLWRGSEKQPDVHAIARTAEGRENGFAQSKCRSQFWLQRHALMGSNNSCCGGPWLGELGSILDWMRAGAVFRDTPPHRGRASCSGDSDPQQTKSAAPSVSLSWPWTLENKCNLGQKVKIKR